MGAYFYLKGTEGSAPDYANDPRTWFAFEVEGDKLLVHALFEETATPDAFTEMDERSRRAVDGSRAGKPKQVGT